MSVSRTNARPSANAALVAPFQKIAAVDRLALRKLRQGGFFIFFLRRQNSVRTEFAICAMALPWQTPRATRIPAAFLARIDSPERTTLHQEHSELLGPRRGHKLEASGLSAP